jgi:hypothetical protein
MVPLYSIESFLGLVFYKNRLYWETLRDLYEAFVIFSFFQLLVEYLGGEEQIVADLEDKVVDKMRAKTEVELDDQFRKTGEIPNTKDLENIQDRLEVPPVQKHVFPFCCLPAWTPAHNFLFYAKWGTLQYVYIKFISAIVRFITQLCDVYEDGEMSPTAPFFYDLIINNISQVWALYNLALFYLSTKEFLAPIRPVAKFLCIKLVVFATFWQSVLIVALKHFDLIPTAIEYNEDDVGAGLQNFAICFEMLIAAIAHRYVFLPTDFEEVDVPKESKRPIMRMLGSVVNVADVFKKKHWKKPLKSSSKEQSERENEAKGAILAESNVREENQIKAALVDETKNVPESDANAFREVITQIPEEDQTQTTAKKIKISPF